MRIDEGLRHRLHTRLAELLGDDEAAAVMSGLAPIDWSQVATREDVAAAVASLEQRIDIRFDAADARLQAAKGELLAAMRQEIGAAVSGQTKVVIATMVSGMVGVGSLVVAAANLA